METISKICVAISVIVISLILLRTAFWIRSRVLSCRILGSMRMDIGCKRQIGELLHANFLSFCIFSRPRFPVPGNSDAAIEIDHIVVNRGGILLISVCPFSGTVENPFHGDWRQFYRQEIVQFRNPLDRNGANARVLNALLKREKLYNIPISGIAVFPDHRTRFKNRIEQVMTVNRLIPYIKDMNKSRFLSEGEIRRTVRALRKCCLPASPGREKEKKSL